MREFPVFMGSVAGSRLTRVAVLTACLDVIAFLPAAAQLPPEPGCMVSGTVTTSAVTTSAVTTGAVTASAVPASTVPVSTVPASTVLLPGVAIDIHQGNRLIASTSTTDDGRWQAAVPSGASRISFDLRGFAPLEIIHLSEDGSCNQIVDARLTIAAMAALIPGALPQAAPPAQPAQTVADAGAVVAIRGRAASVNRAAIRERAAAIARGDVTVGRISAAQPLNGRTTVAPATGAAPPLATLATGVATGTGALTVAAQRAPLPPAVGARQLFSATASYTVAGSALDSAPYQLRADSPSTKPDYLRQSADFTIGGPLMIPGTRIRSPKTNATLSYSAIRGGNLFDQYATVPTAAMRAGDLSALSTSLATPLRDPITGMPFDNGLIPADRISAASQALLAFLPSPNGTGTSRNFHYTSTNRSTQDSLNLRLTHPLAGTDAAAQRGGRGNRPPQSANAFSATLNGQVEFRRNINDRLSALPAIAGVGNSTNLRIPLSLNVTRRATQHAVSFGYTRNTNDTTNRYAGVLDVAARAGIAGASPDPFAWGIPTLSFATLTSVNDLTPSERTDERLTLGYSWSRGVRAHRLRLGGDVGTSRSTNRTDQNARGGFVFTGLYSGSDFGDFLLGQPQQASVQYGPGVVHLTGQTLSLYAQDDWRRWSNVTINAGLRYELVTPYRDESGRLANLDAAPGFTAVAPVASGGIGVYSGQFPDALVRTDANNLAPRIGAAWRVASRTTLRAGYGVSFNTGSYAQLARQLSSQPPFAVTTTIIGTPTQPLSLASALSGAAAQDTSATRNTFGVARNYDAGIVSTWTLDLSRDMGDAWNVSAGLTRSNGSHLDIVRAPNRGPTGLRLPDVQPFLWQTSEGRSRLRSATIRLRRWYVRGISTSVNYTLARSMDNASTIGGGATVVAQDEQNLGAEWGPSSFSRRHQLSGDLNFELPFGDGKRWLNRGGPWVTLLGRWSAYITFAAQTGTPLTARVLSNSADVARGTNGTLRADLTGATIAVTHPTIDRFFNTAAFAVPQPGTFGNAGRNLIVGPGGRDLSLQMTRDVSIGTRTLSVQLRTSNLLNLVNFASVDTVVNSPTFGQVLSVRPLRSMQLNLRWKL